MDIKALREEFTSLHGQSNALLESAGKAKRDLTPEEKEENCKRFGRMDEIKSQVDDAQRLATVAAEFAMAHPEHSGNVQLPATPPGKAAFDAERGGLAHGGAPVEFDVEAYRHALNFYARTGDTVQLGRMRAQLVQPDGADAICYHQYVRQCSVHPEVS